MGRGLTEENNRAEATHGRIRVLLLAGLVCAFQFYINLPVLDHGWVDFDDDINIVLNPHLTGGTADTLQWAWTDASYNRRYMPLGWMMFDGLFRLGGLQPVFYHAASWFLAAANAVILFLLARKWLGLRSNLASPGGWQDFCAALSVLLLSVHPLRAEAIGWASGLLYLASTFLASLAVWLCFPLNPVPRSPVSEWLGRLLFLGSLLVYPVQVGLPLLLITAACCPTSFPGCGNWLTNLRRAAGRYAPWLIFAVLVGGCNIVAAASSRTFSSIEGFGDYSIGTRLIHSASLLGHFFRQLLWPANPSPFYGDLGALPVTQKFLLPLGALGAWLIPIIWRRTRLAASLALVACLTAVLPFVGLLDKGQGANDRYTFLLLGVVTIALAELLAKISGRGRAVATGGLLIATALVLPSYREALAVWRTTASLQARVDSVMSGHPDVRLAFARPAMNEFMRGHYPESQQRLRAGFARFGAHPELLGAATFIEETRTSLTGDGRDPSMPPYSFMHLDLAKKHREAEHAFAAKVHADYARQLMAAAMDGK